MKRRDFLTAAAALPVLAAAPAVAMQADTPILRLFRQHSAIIDAAENYIPISTGKAEDEEVERLFYNRSDQIEAEMMALPCTCAADFAAKVIVDTCKGGLIDSWDTGKLWTEARALVGEV